jgi:putative acetyltransferase
MIEILRTDSGNQDFIDLVKHLDADLAERDGIEHSFYAQFNKIDKIKHVVVAYENNKPVGCGAIKEYAPSIMEVKRMYTPPESREMGLPPKCWQSWKRGLLKCLMKSVFWKREKSNQKLLAFTKRTGTR